MLASILERCDEQELEHLFSLQAVLREERQILRSMAAVSSEDYPHLYDEYESLGTNEESIAQFVLRHYKNLEDDPRGRTGQVLQDLQMDGLDEALKREGPLEKIDEGLYEEDVFVEETGDQDPKEGSDGKPTRDDWARRVGTELVAVRLRRHALESKLQYAHLKKFKELMSKAEDDKLEMLDQVDDLDKAM